MMVQALFLYSLNSKINSVCYEFQVIHIQNVFCIHQSFVSGIWVTTLISAWSSLTGPPATNNFLTSILAAHSLPGSQSSLKYKLIVLVHTKT